MIVGMEHHTLIGSEVSNYFIDVHIALGSAACLPHYQRELSIPFSFPDLSANM